MKRTWRLLVCIATVVAIVALIAPGARAQCPSARSFGSFPGGKTGSQVIIDASAFQNNGNEAGQFWEAGNPANGSGVGAAGTCDSQGSAPIGWWQFVGTTDLRGIRGFLAQPGCTIPICPGPGAALTFLVEDQTPDGSDAGFIAYSVDDSPAGHRWWDLARTDKNAQPGTTLVHEMGSYPTVVIVSSSGAPPTTMSTNDYPDVGILFHGVQGPEDQPLPASAQLRSYDVMAFNGTADPGRARSLWTLVKKIAYEDAAIVSDTISVPCPTDQTTFFAVGLTWDTGVETELVGAASLPVSCDPSIADPDDDTPKIDRPSFNRSPGRAR